MTSLAENLRAINAGERLNQRKPANLRLNGKATEIEAGQGSLKDNLAAVKAEKPAKKAPARKKVNVRAVAKHRIDRTRFCQELIKHGMNASAAYQAVSPHCNANTAKVEGHRLLTDPNVIKILQPMLDRLFTETGIEATYVFRRWVEMSQATPLDYFTINNDGHPVLDMSDLTPAQRANLKEIKITDTKFGRNITIKVYDAQRAVESIAKHLGLLLEKMADEDLERIGDIIERGVKRIKATKDLDGWRDIVLDVDVTEVR